MRPFRSKSILVIAILFTGGFGFLAAKTLLQERQLQERILRMEQDITKAEEKNRELAQLVEYFSKPEHLEKEARMRLNLKLPGEEVVVLSPEPETTLATTSAEIANSNAIFSDILNFFKSLYNGY